jgi:hypothetical protein
VDDDVVGVVADQAAGPFEVDGSNIGDFAGFVGATWPRVRAIVSTSTQGRLPELASDDSPSAAMPGPGGFEGVEGVGVAGFVEAGVAGLVEDLALEPVDHRFQRREPGRCELRVGSQ